MILPDNGKVVIIDDKYDEVKNLMSGLSSEKIPFVYYQDETGGDLPDTPLKNIRLIFLDLLLIDNSEQPVKKVISTIVSRLKKIISVDNGPYILIYWSTKRKKYSKALERELNKKRLSDYKPFEILRLSKPSSISNVKQELATRFDKFKSLKAFLLLESITNKSIGDVVNQFTKIFTVDGSWDKNLKDVLYKTGEARVGEDNFKPLDNPKKIQNSLLTISSTIDETIEKAINEIDFKEVSFDSITKYDTTLEAKAKFNSKLHVFNNIDSSIKSGTVYKSRKYKKTKDKILERLVNSPADLSRIKPETVLFDLTPVCDYSQDKEYVRAVYGICINDTGYKHLKARKFRQQFYRELPHIYFNGEIKYIILDYRFSFSILKSEFQRIKLKPLFKISNELLVELQADFSKHVNRPGIISL